MNELRDRYRLEFLSRLVTTGDLIAKCKQCRTDEERFLLALKIVVQNSSMLFDSKHEEKNSQHSIRSRENGNRSFENGKYYQALREYTESVVYADQSSEELSLAYANRSAALCMIKKYADCIVDIDRSLDRNYPDNLKPKLYKRKGLCLTKLGKPGADSAFKEALVWLDKTNLSEAEINRSRSELGKLISAPTSVAKVPANAIQYPLPEIVTSNSEIPCASDAVAIKYSTQFGRHLVATRQIQAGEILVLEKPYCLRLVPKNVYTHCSHCLKVSWNMIPCKCCVRAAYCSDNCRENAWDDYHQVECSIVGLLLGYQFNNVLWIGVRMAIKATRKGFNLVALKEELTNVDLHADPRTKGYSDDGKFHSDQYRSIYSLENNTDKCSTQDLLIRAFQVAQTVCIIARETEMFGKKLDLDTLAENPDVIFVGGLISRNVHNGYTNIHSFGPSRANHTGEQGHAHLAVASLLNHSCDANTIRQWYTDRMALYAAYPIQQGEQIFDNYGPRFPLVPKGERQRWFNRWHFQCGCPPCTENWPLLENLPSYKRQLLSRESKSKLNKAMRKFQMENSSIQKGILENSPNVLNELLELIELLYDLARKPCGELIMVVSMLKDYYEAADSMFDFEPINLSKIQIERSMYYLCFQRRLSHQ